MRFTIHFTTPVIRVLICEVISFLYVLLFLYAAFSKLMEYENFQLQISRSPFMRNVHQWSEISRYIAWMLPGVEIVLSLGLMTSSLRYKFMIVSLILMCLFTIYIGLILTMAPYIPCVCGGVLQKMSWHHHLVFNIFFIILALLWLSLMKKQ